MNTQFKKRTLALAIASLAALSTSANAALIGSGSLDVITANQGDQITFTGSIENTGAATADLDLAQFTINWDDSILSLFSSGWSIGGTPESETTSNGVKFTMQSGNPVAQLGTGNTDVFTAVFTVDTATQLSNAITWSSVAQENGVAPAVNASSLDYSVNTTPVPVPAAAWLLGSGVLAFAGIRRRKQGEALAA